MQQNTEIEFGYWPIKGLGELNRLVAKYVGVQLKDVPAGQTWQQDRLQNGLDFPNLPYLKHGNFQITESAAINVFLCGYSGNDNLYGVGVQSRSQVQQVISLLDDILKDFFAAASNATTYKQDIEKLSQGSKFAEKIENLSKKLGPNEFIVGGTLTVADIKLAYFNDLVTKIWLQQLQKCR